MTAIAAQPEASTPFGCLNDDVVAEILLRLPSADDVLHCRAVCKAWRRVTSSPVFVAAYSRRHCPLELIVPLGAMARERVLDTIPLLLTLDETRRRRRCLQAPHRRRYSSMASLIGSCDGLLLFEAQPGSAHVVCNPVTKQWIMLPSCRDSYVCGFYLHRPSGEHRLLYLSDDQHGSHHVYSLEAAEAHQLEQAFPADIFCSQRPLDCLNYRGKLHWQQHPLALFSCNIQYRVQEEDTSKIVAFDTESETFRRISLAPLINRNPEERLCLTETDGKLAMAAIEQGSMDLWVLQDYNDDGTWTRRLRVDLPHPWLLPVNAGVHVQDMILLEDCWNHSLCMYDLKATRALEQIQFDGHQPVGIPYSICRNALAFRGSLKRHAFFDRQDPK
ncbi:unnamed protein product [Urochloa decumbens]|uniref:F-box domain-containing protein n=1 Tax=Urochloa decumbens TaxID=240449 RepID=A0ABC8WXH9_9POAL